MLATEQQVQGQRLQVCAEIPGHAQQRMHNTGSTEHKNTVSSTTVKAAVVCECSDQCSQKVSVPLILHNSTHIDVPVTYFITKTGWICFFDIKVHEIHVPMTSLQKHKVSIFLTLIFMRFIFTICDIITGTEGINFLHT